MKKVRKPSLLLLVARVAAIAVLITLLTFAISLFCGIAGVLLAGAIRGQRIDLIYAYRYVALPLASLAFVVAVVVLLREEVPRYRRARAALRLQVPSA